MADTSAAGSGHLASYKHGRYTPLYQLGKGTYGKVLCCRDEYTGERVALKVTHNDAAYRCSALNEIRTLQQLSAHADVVHIRDSFEEQGHVCIVTELLQQNLYEALRARAFAPLHVRDIGKVAVHLLRAVAALHRTGYIHCDIKPENVMLRSAAASAPTLPLAHTQLQLLHLGKRNGSHNNSSSSVGGARVYNAYSGSGAAAATAAAATNTTAYYSDASRTMTAAAAAGDGDAAQTTGGSSSTAATTDVDYDLICLIDFGAVRALHENTYYDVQSLWYRAPEVLCKVPYTPNMDAWSIGCVLYELYTGKALFPGASAQDQLARIVQLVGSPSPATLCASSSTDIATHAAQLTAVLGQQQQQQQLQQLYYGGMANIASGGDAAAAAAMTMSSRTAIEANLRSHICTQRAKALAQFQQQQQQDATALSGTCNSSSKTSSADVADGGSAAYATARYGASIAYTHGTCKSNNNNNSSNSTHVIAATAAPPMSCDADAQAEADLCDLIIALLHPDHHLRLGCAEALQHAFFATLRSSGHNNNDNNSGSSHYHHYHSSMGDVHAATTLSTLCALSAATSTAATTTTTAATASAAHKLSYGHDDYYVHNMYSYNSNNDNNSSSSKSMIQSASTALVAPHAPVQRYCASPAQQATTTRAHALTLQTSVHHTTAPAALHNVLCSPVTLNALPYTSSYVLASQEQPQLAQPQQQQQQQATTTMHALHGNDAVTAYTQQQQQQQCQNMAYAHGAQQGQGGHCARTTTNTAAVYDDTYNDATRVPATTLYDASTATTASLHALHHGHVTSTSNNNNMSVSTSLCNNNNNSNTSALLNGDSSMFVQVGVSPTMLYHVPLSLAHVGVQAVYATDAHNNGSNNNNSAGGYSYASTQHMYSLYSQDNDNTNNNNNSGIGGSSSNNNSMLDLMNSSLAFHDGSDHYATRYKGSHGGTDSSLYSSDNSNSYVDVAAQPQQQQQAMQGALHYVSYHPCVQLATSSQQQQQASNSSYGFVPTTASATTTLYAHPTYNTVTGCYTTGFANTSALHCGVAPMLTQHTPMILTHT